MSVEWPIHLLERFPDVELRIAVSMMIRCGTGGDRTGADSGSSNS